MRFYGKNFVRSTMDRRVHAFTETRDALIWSVNLVARTCEVRIQGTNTNIIAKFPQNIKSTPSWLRKGNSVQISHRSGVRGYVYIIGQGTTIPTAMSGTGTPDPTPLPDAILTGCEVLEGTPIMMGVVITPGTFRINEVEYSTLDGDNWLYYDDPPTIMYDDPPVIYYNGNVTKYLDAAPSVGQYRYDAFVIGEDSVIDYLKGTASATPVKPDIPADHLLMDDYILVIGGVTEIENKHIGMQWTVPKASSIDLDIGGEGISYTMAWVEGTPDPQYVEVNVVVSILDQYLNAKSESSVMTLTLVSGDGDVWSATTGYSDSVVVQAGSGTGYTFKYRREQLVDLNPPVLQISVIFADITFDLAGVISFGEDPSP